MIKELELAIGALLLLVLPLCVAYAYRLNILPRMLRAFVLMLLRLGILGVSMYYLVLVDSIVLDIFAALVVVVYSILIVVFRARLRLLLFLWPVAVGMCVAIVFASGVLLFVNSASVASDYGTRFVLPVIALLSGCIVNPMANALAVYYAGLRNHNHLYYYLIGNGASRAEAMQYMTRRALEKSFVPSLRSMTQIAVITSPIVMWTMIMCGVSVFDAVAVQVLVILAVFASSVVAVLLALTVARRYVADGYAALKSVTEEEKSE